MERAKVNGPEEQLNAPKAQNETRENRMHLGCVHLRLGHITKRDKMWMRWAET